MSDSIFSWIRRSQGTAIRFLLIAFLLPLHSLFGQTDILIVPAERNVRADKGESMMHRKVIEYIAPSAGYYRIYARVWYNSGDEQKNESFFLDLKRNDGLVYTPKDSNVTGPYHIIEDDPGAPHFAWRECGLFQLPAGRYAFWMHHYALIASQFPQYLNGEIVSNIPESVYLKDSLKVVYYPPTDAALKLSVKAPKQLPYQGQLVDVVETGELLDYRIAVHNTGPKPLIAAHLRNVLPEGLTPVGFSRAPEQQQDRQAEWLLPDIGVGDSLIILVTAKAIKDFSPGFTPLPDQAELDMPSDPDSSNNKAQVISYGYFDSGTKTKADLQISLLANTDSTVLVNGAPMPAVEEKGKIDYTLKVKNNGPDAAQALTIMHVLPPHFTFSESSIPTVTIHGDTLLWSQASLDGRDSLSITVSGRVADLIPPPDSLLSSTAQVNSKTDDPNETNNKDTAVVQVVRPFVPPPSKNFDLALQYKAITDTSILINGTKQQAVLAGKNYSYQITLNNRGPKTAQDISLWATVPDSVKLTASVPFTQKKDTLFWSIDSLISKNSLAITLNATVTSKIPTDPFKLFSSSKLIAANDTTANNNSGEATVYAIRAYIAPPPSKNFDLALQYNAITDTSIMVNGKKQQAVLAGKNYSYQLTLSNKGPKTAKAITVWATVPDSVKLTASVPFTQKKDTLFWSIDSLIAKNSLLITLNATVSGKIPIDPFKLFSSAKLIAANDTTAGNNSGEATVYAIRPYIAPPPSKNFDLALQYKAITDTSILINGTKQQAVLAGKNYSYQITLNNRGPKTAKNISLWATMPDSVKLTASVPFTQKKDTLFWSIDSLISKNSLAITLNATVTSKIPTDPFKLFSSAKLIAANDTTASNNSGEATVYAIRPYIAPPPSKNFDLALQYKAVTDTSILINGTKQQAVLAGKNYSYQITLNNRGPKTAQDISLWATMPDSVKLTASVPFTQKKDTLFWSIDSLIAKNSLLITLNATVSGKIPIDPFKLFSSAKLIAANDTTAGNNSGEATVYAIRPYIAPPPSKNFDLALQYKAVTDTSILINGTKQQAVLAGKNYSYQLTLSNKGPKTAKAITVWTTVPDSVKLTASVPFTQKKDTLFWSIDSLITKNSLLITLNATVSGKISTDPFKLFSSAKLIAANDTTAGNNSGEATVYAIRPYIAPPPSKNFDLALQYKAVTDTSIMVNGQKQQAVLAGKNYSYQLTLSNKGPKTAKAITVWTTVPDSVKLTASVPFTQKKDTLFWSIDSLIAKNSLLITLNATVSGKIPTDPFKLFSSAKLIAANDTTASNNSGEATVYAIRPYIPPPPSKNFDLALQYKAVTDTSILINGTKQQAVLAGKNYSYQITLNNRGPKTAKNISLWATMPDSVKLTASVPFTQKKDTLFWAIDSLLTKNSLLITLNATVSGKISTDPFKLFSSAKLIAANDTTAGNNSGEATVYAIRPYIAPPPSKNFDLALQYKAITDTSVLINSTSQPGVRAGKSFTAELSLINKGPKTAKNILLWATVPAPVTVADFTTSPTMQKADSLFWRFDSLKAGLTSTIRFKASVPTPLAMSPLPLNSNALVQAANDTTTANNSGAYLVYAVYQPPLSPPPKPYIEPTSPFVLVGDSVSVRVKADGDVHTWDLWIRYADGRIDSSFADQYILMNPIITSTWRIDLPWLINVPLVTAAREEQIIFELRLKDQFGRLVTAQAAVTVRSANKMVLNRNVFQPAGEEPLAINFKLSSNRVARLDLYDLAGVHLGKLSEQMYNAGWNTYYWNGGLPNGMLAGSGVYIITLHSGEFKDWKKCMIVR